MKITLWAHATGCGHRDACVRTVEIDVDENDWLGMSDTEKHEHMLSESGAKRWSSGAGT